ncbi:hypothetical protein J3A83DRAFT_1577622 [Scleroderma citrinum]
MDLEPPARNRLRKKSRPTSLVEPRTPPRSSSRKSPSPPRGTNIIAKAQAALKHALRRRPRISSSTTRTATLVAWATCFLAGTCVSDKATNDDQPVPTAHVDVQSATQRFSVVGSLSPGAQSTLATIDFTNNAVTQFSTINTVCFQPFNIFNDVVTKLANLHPYAQVALFALTTASQVWIKPDRCF